MRVSRGIALVVVIVVCLAASVQAGPPTPPAAPDTSHHARSAPATPHRNGASRAPADGGTDSDLLAEVSRTPIPLPYVFAGSYAATHATVAGEAFAWAVSKTGDLFTLDGSGAAGPSFAPLGSMTPSYSAATGIEVIGSGAGRRLVVQYGGARYFDVFDLADPRAPELLYEAPALGYGLVVGPAGDFAVSWGYKGVSVVSLENGLETGHLTNNFVSAATIGGPRGAEVLLVGDSSHVSSWDLSTGTPIYLSASDLGWQMLIDGSGSLAVISRSAADDTVSFDVHDVTTMTLLAHLAGFPREATAMLAEHDGHRVLAIAWRGAVRLVGLDDPAAPVTIADLPLDATTAGGSLPSSDAVVPVAGSPWIALALPQERSVALVDTRDGSIVSRWSPGPSIPTALAGSVGTDGVPYVTVISQKTDNVLVFERGGASRLDLFALDDPSAPRRTTGYDEISPASAYQPAVPMGGRYVLLQDLRINALRIVDTSTRAVAATGGLSYVTSDSSSELLAAAGRTIVAGSRYYRRFEVLDVGDGTLTTRILDTHTGYPLALAALDDDTALLLLDDAFVTIARDGTRAVVPLSFPASWGTLEVDPAARFAIARAYDGSGVGCTTFVFDITERSAPRLLWSRADDSQRAGFVRGGDAIVITFGDWGSAQPRLYDTLTGEPLGDAGDAFWQFVYHDVATAFGTGPGARVVFWSWSWVGWNTFVYDLSGPVPVPLGSMEDYEAAPSYAARGDGSGWYESHDHWGFYDHSTPELFLGNSGGTIDPHGAVDAYELLGLRRGFLAGRARADLRSLVLFRDAALNRAPIADAGPDQRLECASPAGTPATFDGRGSSDSDSAPGTQDDLASFAWTLDGAPAGSESVLNATLAPGAHVAALTVTDRLGASNNDTTHVTVVDATSPSLDLALQAHLENAVWAHLWVPTGAATDLCDGTLVPQDLLVLDTAVLAAPVDFVPAAVGIEARIVRRGTGLRVILTGRSEPDARAAWQRIVGSGGVPLTHGRPVELQLPRVAPSPDLVARYRISDDGQVLEAAAAFGPGADHRVRGRAADHAGNVTDCRVSLRATIAALCAQTPSRVVCAGN